MLADRRSRNRRRTNQALLVLVPLAVATGIYANTIGTDWWLDPATVHGLVAAAVVILTPWKAPIVQRGLGRRRPGRGTSVLLLVAVASTVTSGLAHAATGVSRLGPLTTMQVHIGSGLTALILVVAHYRLHPVPVRRIDLERRSFMSAGLLGAAATGVYVAWEGTLTALGAARRRFTGSHERGSFDPTAMPVTSWLDDDVQRISADAWTLTIDGSRLTFDDLRALPADDITATLDCTSAWYSTQVWSAIPLDQLVDTNRRSIEVRSITGYIRTFPTRDLDHLWLAIGVGGQSLSAGHGFPARIVAPDRRGFWWVKWVTSIKSTDRPWWWQVPFPTT